jgi:hypothetical protein
MTPLQSGLHSFAVRPSLLCSQTFTPLQLGHVLSWSGHESLRFARECYVHLSDTVVLLVTMAVISSVLLGVTTVMAALGVGAGSAAGGDDHGDPSLPPP